jgi:hypothetical protein
VISADRFINDVACVRATMERVRPDDIRASRVWMSRATLEWITEEGAHYVGGTPALAEMITIFGIMVMIDDRMPLGVADITITTRVG